METHLFHLIRSFFWWSLDDSNLKHLVTTVIRNYDLWRLQCSFTASKLWLLKPLFLRASRICANVKYLMQLCENIRAMGHVSGTSTSRPAICFFIRYQTQSYESKKIGYRHLSLKIPNVNFFKFRFSNINALIGQMIGQKLLLKSHLHAMIRTHIFNFEWINVENLTSNFLSVH